MAESYLDLRKLQRSLDELAEAFLALRQPGPQGEPGENGSDADPEFIRQLVKEAVDAIPRPENGKNADPDATQAMVERAVAALPKPRAGKDADPNLVRSMVVQAFARLRVPQDGAPGPPGPGLPPGGDKGQIPVKASDADYDFEYRDLPAGSASQMFGIGTLPVTTPGYSDEEARDAIGSALVAGIGISIVVDDPGNTITISGTATEYTDEMAQDAVGGILVDGTTIDFTYDDTANTITAERKALTGDVTAAAGSNATTVAAIAGTTVSGTTGITNVVFSNSPTLVTPALGTPSAIVLTSGTGLPISSGVSGLGANVAAFLASPTTANFAAAVTGETGTGAVVFATSPTLVTPTLGAATATSINKVTITAPASNATIAIANTKVFTVNNSMTLVGTDSTIMTFPTTSATIARTDAANTFTGHQTIEGVTSTGATGTGKLVFDGTPTLVTPVLGAATGTSLVLTGDCTVGASNALIFSTHSKLGSGVDGNITLTNNASNNFSLLQLGGTTSSFPALKRSAAALAVRLSDDSADAALTTAGITASGAVTPATNDGSALGTASLQWSDLFLASGAVVNFANGDVTLTHSSGILTMTVGGSFRFTSSSGSIVAGQSGGYFWANRGSLVASANGSFLLRDNAATSFNLLQWGGTTSSFPAIQRSSAALVARLADDSANADFTAARVISTNVVRLKGYTVATLPAGTQGDTAFVTDALTPAFGVAVVGSGAVVVPVFYDGTNWVVG